jgi:hypothetical protein
MTAELRNLCPVAQEGGGDDVSAGQIISTSELQKTAQALHDNPELKPTETAFADLGSTLKTCFEPVRRHEPLLADMLEARGVRSAGWAVLGHLIDHEFFRQVTPALRERRPLVRQDMPDGKTTLFPPTTKATAYGNYMRSSAAWRLHALGTVQESIEADPNHPRRPLWDELTKAQAECHDRCRAWNDELERRGRPRPRFEPIRRLPDSLYNGTFDNLLNAAQLLAVSGLSYSLRVDPRPSAQVLTHAALSDIDRLNWLASVRHEVTAAMFPPDWDERFAHATTLEEILEACTPEKSNVRALNEQGEYWAGGGLQNGPWRDAAIGLCAGRLALSDSGPKATEQAGEYFVTAGVDPKRVMTPEGAYDQVAVVLSFAARVAEETFYATWPSPADVA